MKSLKVGWRNCSHSASILHVQRERKKRLKVKASHGVQGGPTHTWTHKEWIFEKCDLVKFTCQAKVVNDHEKSE